MARKASEYKSFKPIGRDAHLPGMRIRANGAPVVYLGVYVTPDLAMKARLKAVREGETLSSLVADALSKHLGAA